jgi:hypothetical protein
MGATLALAACVLPPSLFERSSLAPRPEDWQEYGRFRQSEDEAEVEAARPPLAEELVAGSLENPAHEPAARAPRPNPITWDGGVVDGLPQGRVQTQEGSPRGLEPPSGSRTHIIELYQQVVDERDALAVRVDKLTKELEKTRLALEVERHSGEELGARVTGLETERESLLSENQTLAARLVQAQIRRLEAEKLLLETRLEQERVQAAEAVKAVGGATSAPRAGRAHE